MINRKRNFNAAYPDKKETKKPITAACVFNTLPVSAEVIMNLTKEAPKIEGIARRKEYVPENPRAAPKNRLAEIVDPEREIPGSIENAWTAPITTG